MPFGEQHGDNEPDNLALTVDHRLNRGSDLVAHARKIFQRGPVLRVRAQCHVLSLTNVRAVPA
jgi:hypothetical protein